MKVEVEEVEEVKGVEEEAEVEVKTQRSPKIVPTSPVTDAIRRVICSGIVRPGLRKRSLLKGRVESIWGL